MDRLQDRIKTHLRHVLDHPTGLEDIQVDDFATSQELRSWERVRIPDRLRFSARLAIKLLLLFAFIIAWVPWTQTVTAFGRLSAYSPYERPQDIEAQIAGRILKWHVYEGVHVARGDLILELQDVDPNFMAPDLLALLEQSRAALEQTRQAALDRADQLGKRITEMQNLVKAAVPSAEARVVEAENKVREAEQRVASAQIALETAELNVERHRKLAAEGLVSQRELELAIQGVVTSRADLQSSRAALKGAQQGMRALQFGRDQISADVVQRLLDAEASRAGALAEAARAANELASINLRLSNATERRIASRVYAPIDGTVVRMAQVGPGETVKPGDKLVRISPDSTNVAVELVAEGVDAPLLNPGRKVRLLFHGIPAIPLPAWPDLMAGTFGGEILVVDRVADDQGKFRFWVIPDSRERCWPVTMPESAGEPSQVELPCTQPGPTGETGVWSRAMSKVAQLMYYVQNQDRAWPPQMHVRQGTKVMGWVVLNRVPLWYEIWRRFNLFPPDYREGTPSLLDTLLPKAGRGAK